MKPRHSLLGAALALFCTLAVAAVDVNTATQSELETVKGVGSAMSGKIVEARKSGTFKDWPDLQARVKGIGPGSSTKLSAEGLTVGGRAYGETAPAAALAKAPKTVKATPPAAPRK